MSPRPCTHFGKGDDRDETEPEAPGCIPVQIMSSRGNWHEQQQEIQPRAEDEPSIGVEPGWFTLGLQDRD
jgi:hypothetical protein